MNERQAQDERDEHDNLVNEINENQGFNQGPMVIDPETERELNENETSCKKCIHVGVCVAYRGAVAIKADFDGRYDFAKLPMVPEALATNCKQFLRPQA